ncbi:MAG: hypothetical protein WCD70_14525 [Alphaproteobacteria bacterium]
MKKTLTKSAVCLLAVSAFFPAQDTAAQTTASCLPSPSTVDCDEPIIAASTNATISPTFPNPSPTCKIVTNACAFGFAVPVASQQEWSSFLQSTFVNTPGSCASVSDCEADCSAGNWGVTSWVDHVGQQLVLSGCAWTLPDASAGTTQAFPSIRPNPGCEGMYPIAPGIGWFSYNGTLRLLSVTCTPSGYQGTIQATYPNCEAGGRVRRCLQPIVRVTTVNLTKE